MLARRLLLVCCLPLGVLHAAPFDSAVKKGDLALPQCQVFRNGKPVATASGDTLLDVLGLSGVAPHHQGWAAGHVEDTAGPTVLQYRIAFQQPRAIGSLFVQGAAQEVYTLKPDAQFPGDPTKPGDWEAVEIRPHQAGARLVTFPVGFKTRALLLKETRTAAWSALYHVRLLQGRLHNLTPSAWGYGSREYTPPMSVYTYSAMNLVRGRGEWRSSGNDNNGRIPTPPISELQSEWFVVAWPQAQQLAGFWSEDNFVTIELEQFTGSDDVNPAAGTEAEWKNLKEFRSTPIGKGRWVTFDPVTTRGLRIRVTKADKDPQIATITGLQMFTDLAAAPLPELPPTETARVAPKQVTVDVPQEGTLTVVLNDAEGRRVRNLTARQLVEKGKHGESWNLRDEYGNYVAPGTYRWQAISMPPLKLRYETTVYPNTLMHAPDNAPWITGASGSGGWLADHTPPVGVCTAGDRVYLSAYVAESGVSFIECDLTGKKLWGHHSFAAWTGPRFLASDGKTVFVGSTILNTTTDAIWAVDIASKKVTEHLSLTPTATRKRGMRGIAARPSELAISIQGQENWFANAAAAEDVDPTASLPLYGEKRKPRVANEIVPDNRKDFLRLFRLVEHPSGGETGSTLTYLSSMKGSEPQQHIVLAFQRPVPIGSVVFPVPQTKEYRVRLSTLKPGATWPPNADKAKDWVPFETHGAAAWDVIAAPENTVTRALRVSFVRGSEDDDDPFTALLDKGGDDDVGLDVEKVGEKKKPAGVGLGDGDATRWAGQIEGLKILRRRFVSLAPKATVRVSSGEVSETGEWDAQRREPLTTSNPGVYLMEFEQPEAVRGLAIREIDGKLTKVDVWTGPANGEIPLSGNAGWQEVATYEQGRRDVGNGFGGLGLMNPHARYVDGYVDFGREVETRAVRLRVVEQWSDKGQANCLGIRMDLGGGNLDATRCRIFGVAPVQYVGGEPAIDPGVNERVEVYGPDGQLLKEVPVPKPAEIAYNAAGELHTISGTQVVGVNFDGPHKVLISDLEQPTDLAFDKAGNCYVYDAAPARHTVRVYSKAGKFLREIGTPGGFKAGAWVPTRLGEVTAIDIDQQGQLWVVENQYWPKRITVWTTGGEFVKELLGNTEYGGGGVMDPEDSRRVFYGPLEFEIDWKTRKSKLKNLTWLPGWGAGEVPIRYEGRQYLVTRPMFSEKPVGIVYLYEKDHLKLAAAVGLADQFDPLKQPDLWASLGSPDYSKQRFLWSDLNGDGAVQKDEVQLRERAPHINGVSLFNQDLSVQQQSVRYTVKEVLPNGVPVYVDEDNPKLAARTLYKLDNGSYYRFAGFIPEREGALTADGRELWNYVQEGFGVQALGTAQPFSPGQVVSQFGIVGHATAHAGDLGEFVVIHGNTGQWNVWTADGLLATRIFRDLRDPAAQPWSMKEHERGKVFDDVNSGQEHFSGYVCRTKDDKYYAVAGHNHISIVEILGLDQAKRLSGTIDVSADDLQETQDWEQARAAEEVYARAPVLDAFRTAEPKTIDGDLKDWKLLAARMDESLGRVAEFRMAYDDENLYLAWAAREFGPLKNSGDEAARLFKTGASVDLQIETDPAADPARQAPAEGDLRLLLTMTGKKPRIVLYRPVVPGTPAGKAFRVVSPVGETVIDEVRELKAAMAVGGEGTLYIVEAAIPLAELGLRPEPGLRLKLDWGLLTTGPDGNEVLRRIYWANKATAVVADAPSEARLHPNLWGHVRFGGDPPSAESNLEEFNVVGDKKPSKSVKKDVDDLLDDLGDAPKPKPKKK